MLLTTSAGDFLDNSVQQHNLTLYDKSSWFLLSQHSINLYQIPKTEPTLILRLARRGLSIVWLTYNRLHLIIRINWHHSSYLARREISTAFAWLTCKYSKFQKLEQTAWHFINIKCHSFSWVNTHFFFFPRAYTLILHTIIIRVADTPKILSPVLGWIVLPVPETRLLHLTICLRVPQTGNLKDGDFCAGTVHFP